MTIEPISSTLFTEGGKTYSFELTFGNITGDGFLVGNQLHVYENAFVWAPMMAKITEQISPANVPDGDSTVLLLSLASTVLVIMRRGVTVAGRRPR